MTVNRERLIAVVTWAAGQKARADLGLPSEWDQNDWFSWRDGVAAGGHCGTACCIAGKVALEEGWVPPPLNSDLPALTGLVTKGEQRAYASEVAAAVLGLEDDVRLFSGTNTLEDLLGITAELLARGPA